MQTSLLKREIESTNLIKFSQNLKMLVLPFAHLGKQYKIQALNNLVDFVKDPNN